MEGTLFSNDSDFLSGNSVSSFLTLSLEPGSLAVTVNEYLMFLYKTYVAGTE